MILLSLALLTSVSLAAHRDNSEPRPTKARSSVLVRHLGQIRGQISTLEQTLLDRKHLQKNARNDLKKILKLLKLQHTERELGKKRMQELESTVAEMESRKNFLTHKIKQQQKSIRNCLIALESSNRVGPEATNQAGRENSQLLHLSDT
ncbi:MAG: hypothetical protein ABI041_20390, partial [Bdellovibrionia bacterium]